MPTILIGQIDNRWQPDSVYANRKVKKIFVYLNSAKDLSEIVEFNLDGNRKRVEKYNASYNSRTRNSKRLDLVSHYEYNTNNQLIQITDSTHYYNGSFGIDRRVFEYDSDNRVLIGKYYKGKFEKPYNVTEYSYEPLETTTKRHNDSIVVYHKTKEYEKDFYVKRFYGYYFTPKLKKVKTTINGESNTVAYSDYAELERFEDDMSIKNSFDIEGRLIKSEIKSVFMNDRTNEYNLYYKYYKNGLLKSIRGYVPRYFRYEYWEQ